MLYNGQLRTLDALFHFNHSTFFQALHSDMGGGGEWGSQE